MRIFLAIVGTCCVGLGVLGAFLPILPTTPFLLLAAACYARSSETLHRKLLEHRVFGEMIREWQEHRAIPRRAKFISIALIVVTFAVSITFAVHNPYGRILMVCLGLGVIIFLYRLPSRY